MQSAEHDIEGYHVCEINETLLLKDAVASNTSKLYPSWDAAVTAACVLADAVADKYAAKSMCILRNASYSVCMSTGYTISHRLTKMQAQIVIAAVRRQT